MESWMSDFWQLFTGLGAALGFVSTAFLVFDRLLRYRPVATITAERDMGDATPALRIKNTAPFDILIERFRVSPKGSCTVSASHERRAMMDVLTGSDVPIILGPNEERHLVIVTDRSKCPNDQAIEFSIPWRRGKESWLWQWPATVRTSFDDIDLRIRAAMNSPRRS
jgi:hypothetical protein